MTMLKYAPEHKRNKENVRKSQYQQSKIRQNFQGQLGQLKQSLAVVDGRQGRSVYGLAA